MNGDEGIEGEKTVEPTLASKDTKNMVIDEVSESDQSESNNESGGESMSESEAANLKIGNGNHLPLSGGVTPRSKGSKRDLTRKSAMSKTEQQDKDAKK